MLKEIGQAISLTQSTVIIFCVCAFLGWGEGGGGGGAEGRTKWPK